MTLRRLAALVLVAAASLIGSTGVASAADGGRISGVTRTGDSLQIIFQVDGLPEGVTLDPASVRVRIAGKEVRSAAKAANDATLLARVTVLAIDNSQSMATGGKLDSAKQAARAFLRDLPAGVQVGLVTFADAARQVEAPTADRAAITSAIDSLTIAAQTGTALYDGAKLAAEVAGNSGARSVLLLTDGNEDGSSRTTAAEAASAATDNDVAMDAVYFGPDGQQPRKLTDLVLDRTGGTVASADDSAQLDALFTGVARSISSQLVITAALPSTVPRSGTVAVTATAGGVPFGDAAFRSLTDGTEAAPQDNGPIRVESRGSSPVGGAAVPWLLAALFAGLVAIAYVALGTVGRDTQPGRIRRRLSIYTLTGRPSVRRAETTTALGSSQIARSAVELAGRVAKERDLDTDLAVRLEAGGVPLRPAEWMLIHIGVAVSFAFLLLLISGGKIFPTLLGLVIGLVLPWAYLLTKESRRATAFLAQLPDTLQLVAGSLSAGYSMAQAMDSVVREGQQPITGEFNRALVEARLGVPIEDAMDGIGRRMKSQDFAWVVMAIRIQREVGGNLAELLTTVAATMRERERLRRQVQVLSAEGRLSAWILGLLPVVFAVYLALVRPQYLAPLVDEPLGWALLTVGALLLAVGAVWLRKAVKVEV